jgi:hypothetical protein
MSVPVLLQSCSKVTPPLVTVPVHVRFPVAPSTVQPVAALPPARLTLVAVFDPGPILTVLAAPNALTVAALVLKTFNVPVADVERV